MSIDTKTIRDLHAKRGDHPWGSSFEHAAYQHMPELLDAYDRLSALEVESLRQQLAAAQAEAREWQRVATEQAQLHADDTSRLEAENQRLRAEVRDVLANLGDLGAPDDMDVISAAHFVAGALTTAEEALEAAQAEARNWKRIAEDATHVEREELTRVREIVSGMREYADSCDHPSEASKRNAVEYWLTQLEDALSKAAEQHDPLAVSDHCGECGEPEPECACDERESLPLMARREWMRRDTDYFVVHGDFCLEIKALNGRAPYFDESGELVVCAEAGDSIERDQVDAEAQPDGIYRIADTDEHGFKVIPRTADMPEGAKYRLTWIMQADAAGGDVEYTDSLPLALEANRSGAVSERIEDYRPAAQESGDASD